MNRISLIVPLALSFAALPAQEVRPAAAMKMDIVDTAAKAGSFQTLLTAAKAAGLVETLKGDGPFTIFAPSDEAFAKLPEGTIPALLKDKKKLAAILTYHVVPGRVMAKDLTGKQWADTVLGQALQVVADDSGVSVDGAKVVKADINASNGTIHVIDRVIMPREDIVATAIGAGQFKTLVTAVKAADLVKTLQGKGPFTVFAPADSAFAKLPEGTIASLLKDKKKLSSILTYHVIPGRVLAADIPMAKMGKPSVEPKTVQGNTLTIVRSKDSVTVDGAKVVKANIVCGNGVIHVIDTVVMPKK